MLSVPGNTTKRMPRQMEWALALSKAASGLGDLDKKGDQQESDKESDNKDEDEDEDKGRGIYSKAVREALGGLVKHKNIPRKESQFYGFIRRTLKLSDESLLCSMWGAVVEADRLLHGPSLDKLGEGWVSVVEFLEARYRHKVFAVHRLDQATSGVFLMARTQTAAAHLSGQFRERSVSKRYLAEVAGTVPDSLTAISAKLRPDLDDKPRQVVDEAEGKPCETLVKVVSRGKTTAGEPSTVVGLTPITGRTHQLRVHMANMGHPLLGDGLYATGTTVSALPRLALHAHTLKFIHPVTNEAIEVVAPLDGGSFITDTQFAPWPDEAKKMNTLKRKLSSSSDD